MRSFFSSLVMTMAVLVQVQQVQDWGVILGFGQHEVVAEQFLVKVDFLAVERLN